MSTTRKQVCPRCDGVVRPATRKQSLEQALSIHEGACPAKRSTSSKENNE